MNLNFRKILQNPYILSLFCLIFALVAIPLFVHAGYGYDDYGYDNGCYSCGGDVTYVTYPSLPPFHPVTIQQMFPSYNPRPAPIVPIYPVPVPAPYPVPVPTPVYIPAPIPVYIPAPTPIYISTPSYPPLSVYCSANTTYANVGTPVTWTAYVSGGNYSNNVNYGTYNYNNGYNNGYSNGGYNNYNGSNGYNSYNNYGPYSYSWSGSEGIISNNQSVTVTYNTPGQKVASVTVYGAGSAPVMANCNNVVSVAAPYYVQPIQYPYPVPVQNGLDIGCFADPARVAVNQPITWTAEVTGGLAPYTYSWSGTNDLSGYQNSVTKFYGNSGDKYAIVNVTSADGRSGSRACSNSVHVRGTGIAKPACPSTCQPVPKPTPACECANNTTGYANPTPTPSPTPGYQAQNQLMAGPIFSLANVPWGWVAFLVILVLIATVIYLIVNRPKI